MREAGESEKSSLARKLSGYRIMQQSYRRSCDNEFWQQLYSCMHMKCLHFQHPVQNEMFLPDTLCLCFNMKMRLTISVSTRMSLEVDSVVSLISKVSIGSGSEESFLSVLRLNFCSIHDYFIFLRFIK